MTGSQREVAHLALDAARITSAATGDDPVLKDLLQDAFMKALAQLRGE
jgi:DNA-directed RNA polymerase specialized sigma24 family protein